MTVFCMQVYFLAFLFWFSLSISFARVVQHKMWTDKARSMQTDKSTSHEHCTMHQGKRAARHVLDWKSCCMCCLGLFKVPSHPICLALGLTCTICTPFLPLVHLWARPLDYWSWSLQSNLVADLPTFSQRQDLKGQWRWQVGLCKAKIHKKINTEGNKVVCEKPQEFDDCH